MFRRADPLGGILEANYIEIMLQSLLKKKRLLEQIIELNQEQKLMNRKGRIIDDVNLLDDGFEQLYVRVKEELNLHKDQYADQIRKMQDTIRELSALHVSIETQEQRNKVLVEQKFDTVRKQVKSVRNSQKVVKQYYDNMVKLNQAVPQYVDDKK